MKRVSMFLSITGLFAFLFVVSASAESYVSTNLESAAVDTSGIMLPTDGVNWASDLKVSIEYPQEALEQGLEGEVIVLATVNAEGKVADVKIFKDIGGGAGMAVATAVRKMQFNPASQNGIATSYTMAIPVIFELEESI